MIETSMTVDQASLARFAAGMDKVQAAFGRAIRTKNGGGIIETAAVKLVVALGARTAVSKKRRKVIDNPAYSQARAQELWRGKTGRKATREAKKVAARYAVLFDFRKVRDGVPVGKGSAVPVWGMSKSEANKSILAQINDYGTGQGRRKLAKRSWNWTLKALGKSDGTEYSGATASDLVITNSGDGTVATWTGTNKLAYMNAALTAHPSAAMNAAAKMMVAQAEREVERITRAAGY